MKESRKNRTKKLKKIRRIRSSLMLAGMLLIMILLFNLIKTVKLNNTQISSALQKIETPIEALATDNIASGTSGTCSWVIDKDENLIVWPTDEVEGTLNSNPWTNYKTLIKTIRFEGKVYAPSNSMNLFALSSKLESIDFTNFDTSRVTSMQAMFRGCTALTELDLSSFDTSNVTNMCAIFQECTSLKEINLSGWDTSKVTTMRYMFNSCSALKQLDLSSFDTRNVTTMESMFTNCRLLYELDISNFNTSNVTNMWDMWNSCKVKKIKLGSETNLKTNVQSVGGSSFGRGTWKNLDTGEELSAVEICRRSISGEAEGTYIKLSDISDEMSIDFPVTYRIGSVTKIDEFSTDRTDIYSLSSLDGKDVVVLAKLPLSTTSEYVLPGSVEVILKNVVFDELGNTYDMKLTIDNIHFYDLVSVSGVTDVNACILRIISNQISYYTDFYNSSNASVRINDKNAGMTIDVATQILDKQGNPVQGSYIFSAYDLDLASAKDSNSTYKDNNGRGYGNYSEGINLLNGYDLTTLKTVNDTFLQNIGGNRLTRN